MSSTLLSHLPITDHPSSTSFSFKRLRRWRINEGMCQKTRDCCHRYSAALRRPGTRIHRSSVEKLLQRYYPVRFRAAVSLFSGSGTPSCEKKNSVWIFFCHETLVCSGPLPALESDVLGSRKKIPCWKRTVQSKTEVVAVQKTDDLVLARFFRNCWSMSFARNCGS